MIATWDVALNAERPEIPLPAFNAFVGSPSSVRLRNVPRRIGKWDISAVQVTVNFPDNTSRSANCVLVGGVWVGTLPASASVGASVNGVRVTASGTDENGAAVTGYVLGQGDAAILATDGTITVGTTTYYAHIVDSVPTSPKKGDMAVIGGVWKLYDGTQWIALGASGNYVVSRDVGDVPERYTLADIRNKVNALVAAVGNRVTLSILSAFCFSSAFAAVHTARLDALYNDSIVVTNVTQDAVNETDPVFGAWLGTNAYVKAETDPTVPAWAKADTKPTYTAAEVGARAANWVPAWGDVTGKPQFAAVATSGSYTDLSNKPTIPAEVTENTVSGWGFIKTWTETDPTVKAWAKADTKPTYTAAEVGARAANWVPAWGDVTGKPQFAAVATSGSYTDLSNKPDLSAYATEAFVTNRVAAAEALVNQSPCWSTAGAWGIEYKLSATSSSQTIVTGWTNEDGRAWSQMRTHFVRNLEADCFGALYDEITIETLRVGGWRCLTAGGSITAAGHLTANASGVYVVSATNQNGQIRFAEIPISNGAQDVADVEVYVGDVAGTARKAVNDEALAWMNAAPNHGAGIYGTESTWYNWGYFTQPAWAATSAANTGNDKPFALGTKLLAGATHYPDWCKWEGFQTIGSTTVKKGEWVRLDHWALSNGWNGAQVAAMNLSDISLVLVTEGSIPLADCPYLITEAKLNETFAGTIEGVQGWAATQMHTDPIQLVYSTADGTAWRYAMGSERNRLDIKTKLLTMGSAYPIHSGDSGHPVYFHHDNKWVLTSHFYSAANGPSYVKALPVIRAFAASVGCSLNVIE